MKIREIKQRAENLIEQGENAKQRQVHYQQQANSARVQVVAAYARLEAASKTDEQGNPVGDVTSARSDVYAAQALLQSAETNLGEANRQLERVGRQKMDTVHEIERYEAVEEGNMSKLAELQRKRFGSNANAFMADLVARMNSGEQARQQLLHSMGLSASNKNYTTTSSGSHTYTSTASGDEKISNSEIDTGNTHSFSATQLSKYHSLRRLLHIAQLLDLRQKLTSVQALEMLMCEADSEQTYGRARTHEEIIADMRKSVRDNWLNNFNADKWKNIVSEAQYKERLALYRKGLEQIVGENIIKNLSDSQLERLSVIQNTAFLEGVPLSIGDIINYCKNPESMFVSKVERTAEIANDKMLQSQAHDLLKAERFSEDKWEESTISQKKEIISSMIKEMNVVLGTDVISEVEYYYDDISGSRGAFVSNLNKIQINEHILSDYESYAVLYTVIHEMRHAYQHYAINHPEKVVVSQETLCAWKENMKAENYKSPQKGNTYEEYISQPIEWDAKNFAKQIPDIIDIVPSYLGSWEEIIDV